MCGTYTYTLTCDFGHWQYFLLSKHICIRSKLAEADNFLVPANYDQHGLMYGIIQFFMTDISHLKFCGYVGNKKCTNLLEHYQSEDQGKDWNKSLCHSWKEVVKNTEGWNWLTIMYKGRISLYHQWWIFDFYYWRDGRQSLAPSVRQLETKKILKVEKHSAYL